MTHYHAMNGTRGCLPDNSEIYDTKEQAIESLCNLFEHTISARRLTFYLEEYTIYYFDNSSYAGAEYAQVVECHDIECIKEENQ